TDAYVTGALLGWLSKPESLAVIAGPSENWHDRIKEAEALVARLRQRLDEAAEEYAAGRISLAMLSSIEKRLNPEIEQVVKATVPPVPDNEVVRLMQAEDIEAAWERLDLLEKRRIIKLLLDIRVTKAPQLGGKFDPNRIKIAPRFVPHEQYRWTRSEQP